MFSESHNNVLLIMSIIFFMLFLICLVTFLIGKNKYSILNRSWSEQLRQNKKITYLASDWEETIN
jgi:purine-cytosine permease-like protein